MSPTDYIAGLAIALSIIALLMGLTTRLGAPSAADCAWVDDRPGANSVYENWDHGAGHVQPAHGLEIWADYEAGCGRCLFLLDRVNTAFTGALGEQDQDEREAQRRYDELETKFNVLLDEHASLDSSYKELQERYDQLMDENRMQDMRIDVQRDTIRSLREQVDGQAAAIQTASRLNGIADAPAPVKKPRAYTRRSAKPAPILEVLD